MAVGQQVSPERRRPGRMTVELGAEPGTQVQRAIRAYRTLIDCVDGVLVEVDGSREERARLVGYRAQFEAQVEHRRSIARRADAIVDGARLA